MAVSIVILIILGILAAAASGEDAAGTKKMMVPFRKMGIWTAEKIKKYSFKDSGNRLKQDLTALEREEGYLTEEEYCARKLETAFFILFVGAGAAIFINIAVQETAEPVKESIERPAYGQGPAEEELEAVIEGEEEARQIPVTISPRAYTPSEVKSLLEDAVEEIDKSLSGQNKSLDEVRNTLNLQKTASGGAVTVEWSVIPYGVLDDNGKVCLEQ